MPTWTGGAPGSTGAWNYTGGGIGTFTSGTSFVPNSQRFGMRWAAMTVPKGAAISSATLGLSGIPAAGTVGAHQVDNAPALGNGQQTTTNTPTGALPSGAGAKTVDVTASVQALVDRAGWASGNAIVLRAQSTGGSSLTVSGITLTVVWDFPVQNVTAVTLDQAVAVGVPGVAPAPVSRTAVTLEQAVTVGVPAILSARVLQPATLTQPVAVGVPGVAPSGSGKATAVALAQAVAFGVPGVTGAGSTSRTAVTLTVPVQVGVPGVGRVWPDPEAPMDWQTLAASPGFLQAITARTPTATFSVDVLPPDGTGDPLARFGGPHERGPYAPTRGGFEGIQVHCKGDNGKGTWGIDLTTKDPTLLPEGINPNASLLDPFQHNLLRVWWWVLVDDVWQRIPCGTGTISATPVNDGANGFVLTVVVQDMLADIARAKWDESVPLGGAPVSDAVGKILASRFPRRRVSVAPTTQRLPDDWAHGEPDADPTEDLARLAEAVGAVARTNRLGDLILDPVQDRATAPVKARFVEGESGDGVTAFHAVSTSLVDMDQVVNACSISSASPSVDPPVGGHFEISDDTHPLFVGNGRYSRSISNAIITTPQQATTMARNYVLQHSVVRELTIEHTPRPDLNPGDVVEVTRIRAGIAGRWTVVGWTLSGPLGPQQTTLVTERRWADG